LKKDRLLYIHIPFCDSKCYYCAFNSYIDKNHLKSQYTKALIEDLKNQFDYFEIEKKSFSTLFIGGGTPSVLNIPYYEDIFNLITPYLKDDIEITSEINPSATKEWINDIKDFGINRISVGVQSFDEKKLKLLNRNHTSKKAINTINTIYDVGIDNISLDLIYDVNIDSKELLLNDINIATSLPITHISSYSLSIEKDTPFAKIPTIKLDDDSLAIWWIDMINKYGFSSYEISSFAKDILYQCKHNKGYWSYKEYIGAGCGAIGCIDDIRYISNRDIDKYIKNPLSYTKEILDKEDIRLEIIFLGFRSNIGVCLDVFTQKEKEKIDILLKERKLVLKNTILFNTSFLLSDEIVSFICF
jgi:oxygen-independent coproporphyrinogen-3 oxidase